MDLFGPEVRIARHANQAGFEVPMVRRAGTQDIVGAPHELSTETARGDVMLLSGADFTRPPETAVILPVELSKLKIIPCCGLIRCS